MHAHRGTPMEPEERVMMTVHHRLGEQRQGLCESLDKLVKDALLVLPPGVADAPLSASFKNSLHKMLPHGHPMRSPTPPPGDRPGGVADWRARDARGVGRAPGSIAQLPPVNSSSSTAAARESHGSPSCKGVARKPDPKTTTAAAASRRGAASTEVGSSSAASGSVFTAGSVRSRCAVLERGEGPPDGVPRQGMTRSASARPTRRFTANDEVRVAVTGGFDGRAAGRDSHSRPGGLVRSASSSLGVAAHHAHHGAQRDAPALSVASSQDSHTAKQMAALHGLQNIFG